MKSYVHGDSLILQGLRDGSPGLRPSHQELLSLIDESDPAWPKTAAVLREMAEAGVEIDATIFAAAAKVGAHRLAMLDAGKAPERHPAYEKLGLASGIESIVYYIRRGEVIKIGTSTSPAARFEQLMPDEILAFEPGTITQERARHRQFAHLRCQGEHFRPEPELLEHARHLRQMYGDPDPSWPTVARLADAPADPHVLPSPVTGEKVTANEGCARLGIKRGTLHGWKWRGRLAPAGRDDRGLLLYYVEHLIALRDNPVGQRMRAALDKNQGAVYLGGG